MTRISIRIGLQSAELKDFHVRRKLLWCGCRVKRSFYHLPTWYIFFRPFPLDKLLLTSWSSGLSHPWPFEQRAYAFYTMKITKDTHVVLFMYTLENDFLWPITKVILATYFSALKSLSRSFFLVCVYTQSMKKEGVFLLYIFCCKKGINLDGSAVMGKKERYGYASTWVDLKMLFHLLWARHFFFVYSQSQYRALYNHSAWKLQTSFASMRPLSQRYWCWILSRKWGQASQREREKVLESIFPSFLCKMPMALVVTNQRKLLIEKCAFLSCVFTQSFQTRQKKSGREIPICIG